MPFEIVRNDITEMRADAIVNAANTQPVIGAGVDSGIHKKAGPRLLAARQKIGEIAYGDAALTPAFGLRAKYVIHAATPVWQGGTHGETALLESCYTRALQLALEAGCESVAFPLLAAGSHGFPKETALQTAVDVFRRFLLQHDMHISLAVFGESSFALSAKLFRSVKSFIDENYVLEKQLEEYGTAGASALRRLRGLRQQAELAAEVFAEEAPAEEVFAGKEAPKPCEPSVTGRFPAAKVPAAPAAKGGAALDELLLQLDESFSQALLRLIDSKGLTDPEVYKRANIDRKLFSKIKNNPHYRPGKVTCVAFAIALGLDMPQTQEFIGKAGYTLTHSSKFDIIIEYFIRQGIYDTFRINETLFDFDQPLIGG